MKTRGKRLKGGVEEPSCNEAGRVSGRTRVTGSSEETSGICRRCGLIEGMSRSTTRARARHVGGRAAERTG
jgi:hypothetical protein